MSAVEIRRAQRPPAGVSVSYLSPDARRELAASLGGSDGPPLDQLLAELERSALLWLHAVLFDEQQLGSLQTFLRELSKLATGYLALPTHQRSMLVDVVSGFSPVPQVEAVDVAVQKVRRGMESIVPPVTRGRRVPMADLESEGLGYVAVDGKVSGRATAVAADSFVGALRVYRPLDGNTTSRLRSALKSLMSKIVVTSAYSAYSQDGGETPLLLRNEYRDDGWPSPLKIFAREISRGIPAANKRANDNRRPSSR